MSRPVSRRVEESVGYVVDILSIVTPLHCQRAGLVFHGGALVGVLDDPREVKPYPILLLQPLTPRFGEFLVFVFFAVGCLLSRKYVEIQVFRQVSIIKRQEPSAENRVSRKVSSSVSRYVFT